MENAQSAGDNFALEIAVCMLMAKTDWQLDQFDKLANGLVASCMRALPSAMPEGGPQVAAEFMVAARQKLVDLAAMAQAMRSLQHKPGETPD